MIGKSIVSHFRALPPASQNPVGFLDVVHRKYPRLTALTKAKPMGWDELREHIGWLSIPSYDNSPGYSVNYRVDLSKSLLLDIETILSQNMQRRMERGKAYRDSKVEKDGSITFCRYCWRLGPTVRKGSGFEKQREKWGMTHAYCGVHRPVAEKTVIERKGRADRVVTFVNNRKEIRKGRKFSRLSDRIERRIIAEDRAAAALMGNYRAWLTGAHIIDNEKNGLWYEFVRSCFPYAAHHNGEQLAAMSPVEAFGALEAGNEYRGKRDFHNRVLKTPGRLSLYLMPMMLRFDVWLQIECIFAARKKRSVRFFQRSYPSSCGRSEIQDSATSDAAPVNAT